MRIAAVLAATLSLVSLPARADTAKAWSAAKAGLPTDTKVVFALDVAALQKTQVFAALWPKLVEKFDASKVIDAIKTDCKIDPLVVVQGVVVAFSEDHSDGAAYVAIAGIDKARVTACLQKELELADKGAAKVTVKQDGNITQVSNGKDSMFVGWASKDVVVVPLNQERARLVKWMTGKSALARTTVGKKLLRVNTAAMLWGAGEGTHEVEPGVTVTGGYGAVAFAKGNVDANLHAIAQTDAQAKTLADSMQQQLDDARGTPILPPSIASVLRAIVITSASEELVIKANVVENDLVSAASFALGAM